MTNLMYAASDKLTPRSEMISIPTPASMGRRHSPYPFAAYIDQVEESLERHGFLVMQQEYVVTADQQQFFGLMEIQPRATYLAADEKKDWTFQVGLRGSHNQTLPRGLLLGTKVIVCSNLCFHGNIGQFKTMQTTNMSSRLPSLIRQCLSRVAEDSHRQDVVFGQMKEREIKDITAKSTLIDLMDQKALSAPQVLKARKEWLNPSYDHGSDPSVWRLFNACTEALKPGGDNVNMALVEQRSRLVSDYCTALAA